jgi:hypothetical protein
MAYVDEDRAQLNARWRNGCAKRLRIEAPHGGAYLECYGTDQRHDDRSHLEALGQQNDIISQIEQKDETFARFVT